MIRAVLDPGVLVAAAITPRGICGRVLVAAIDGRFSVIASPAVVAELNEVLLRPKFRRYLSEEEADQYVSLVSAISSLHKDPPSQSGLTPDPDDEYLVALAQDVNADYLISGDPHLTGIPSPRPPILTPRAFLEWLDTQQ